MVRIVDRSRGALAMIFLLGAPAFEACGSSDSTVAPSAEAGPPAGGAGAAATGGSSANGGTGASGAGGSSAGGAAGGAGTGGSSGSGGASGGSIGNGGVGGSGGASPDAGTGGGDGGSGPSLDGGADGAGRADASADAAPEGASSVPKHSIGGTVSGLLGGTLVLKNNGGDALSLGGGSSSFVFPRPVAEGTPYVVSIASMPSGHSCSLAGQSGTVGVSDVGDVQVTCRLLSVAINEVYARVGTAAFGDTNGDGVRDATEDEFIEILNNEDSAVDLGDWVVRTGTTAPAIRFTFPHGTSLAAKSRAVVFGGGTPTGGFGGALTFAINGGSGLALADAPSPSCAVGLEAAGVTIDGYSYDATVFGATCTAGCTSRVRSPEGTGSFVAHQSAAAAGATGALWSPGVAAPAAIPKAKPTFSVPASGATNVSTSAYVTAQFDMLMNAGDFDNAHLRVFQSDCTSMTNEVTAFSSLGAGRDATSARMIPSLPLAYSSTYCVSIAGSVRSALGVLLDAPASWQMTTRAAASAPASSVVISEVGGCRLGSTNGTTACGGSGANDEFVELYNPTNAAVDISGWMLQRRSAGGTSTCGATVPTATTMPAGHYYLIAGQGYTASRYPGGTPEDLRAAGSLLTGGTAETVALIASSGTCTGSIGVVDAVSFGAVTDALDALELPPFSSVVADGTSVERKACYDSTADATTTGMLPGGGHESRGNRERIGSNNADFIVRPSPGPQNSASAVEGQCAQ
ncbi:MAG TPA: lamin tail domain-containing protein [Polyangiaceae bacterium]|nr:lamin tail domain-containing protein [Polyangiaceae bacterium]